MGVARTRTYQVKDVARLAGISIRTLHHYDAIGLLVPAARSSAGYRLYTDNDIDVALAALDGSRLKGEMNMEDLFEGFNAAQYAEEARREWGNTDAFVESQQRVKRYRPDDWKAIEAEQAAVYDDASSALKAGKSPSDAAVMDIAERHRLAIDRWFYACNHAMHRGLASMYESDDRFRQSIDKHGEGLTTFLAEAIRANAARQRD